MALLPCQFQPHRFRGKSGMLYPALVDRGDSLRWRIRICPEHWDIVEDALKDYEVTEDSILDPPPSVGRCPTCLQLLGESVGKNMYVTAYPPGQDRRDYWAQLHGNCGAPAWLPFTVETTRASG